MKDTCETLPSHTEICTYWFQLFLLPFQSLSTILATTGIGKKDSPPGLNTIAATATTTLGYQAPYPTPAVTTGNIGTLYMYCTLYLNHMNVQKV